MARRRRKGGSGAKKAAIVLVAAGGAAFIAYELLTAPPVMGMGQMMTLTVTSTDMTNTPITGYFVTVDGQSGNTPATFTLNVGTAYTITPQDFGSVFFDHWSDTGLEVRGRSFMPATTSPITYTAAYHMGVPTNGTGTGINVNAIDASGNKLDGFSIAIFNSVNTLITSAFTPCTFLALPTTTYSIYANSFGAHTFNHWLDDNSTNPMKTFTTNTAASELSFVAQYS